MGKRSPIAFEQNGRPAHQRAVGRALTGKLWTGLLQPAVAGHRPQGPAHHHRGRSIVGGPLLQSIVAGPWPQAGGGMGRTTSQVEAGIAPGARWLLQLALE